MDNVLCHKAVSMVPMHTAYYKKPNSILARFLFHGHPTTKELEYLTSCSNLFDKQICYCIIIILYSIKYTGVENSQQMLCCSIILEEKLA